ncbi:UNVERIFIED_CONTAM: hypothetical protein Sangu_0403400 [Sesamum angustifolium]|uniref:SWIM-type domain-containing protein n=1 Tax=Sesamum angustifolium TaxID=2727405 RepID=A0AAW2QTS8_9LAMI
MSESFNHMVLRARSKHIVDMLETIRLILMKRVHMRRDQMMKHTGDLCPKIAKILEDMKKKSMEFIAHWNGKDEFEIEYAYGTRFRLHLGDKTCSCRRWDLTGIPCPHAICGMYYMGHIPEEYVHECYKKETFINTYSQLMGTLNDMDMWPKVDFPPLIPPKCENLPGRPRNMQERKTLMKSKIKKSM